MAKRSEAETWARTQFGNADLGDARRTSRLVRIAARAAERPAGKLSEVLKSSRELDAGYDFFESGHVSTSRLETVVGRATARSCVDQERVHVAIDGSSTNIVDRTGKKGLGRIGADARGGRGLKVMTALAVGADGATIGVLAQSFWARPDVPKRSARQKQKERAQKAPIDKETRHWLETIDRAIDRLKEVNALGWFQLDREADAWPTLLALAASGHWFTVRSSWDRVVETIGRDKQYLRAHMARSPVIATYEMEVTGSPNRTARRAHMVMHAAKVTLNLRDKRTGRRHALAVHVVWVHEEGTTPSGQKALDWMLLTNAPIDSIGDARAVVVGYSRRWRIEEFHRAWKTGACNVEDTQMRSRDAIIRWATILAVVATRIERLKYLSRTEPERPASDELTPIEIEVLIVLKRRYKKRTEHVPDSMPSIEQACRWIADLGGYTGKSSGGPPGSITLARGLERLRNYVEGVLAMRQAGR